MNNLIEKYKYFNLNYEDYCLLGASTPNISGVGSNNNIVNKFLYTYSFLGLNATDFHSLEYLKKVLSKKLNSLRCINNIDLEKQWWCLAIIYLKIGAEYHNFDFFSSTCENILDSIQTINSKELIQYANWINDSLSCLIGYDARIRPHMDIDTNDQIIPLYSKLIIYKNEIIDILKKYITQNELISKDTIREIELIKNIGVEFDSWNIIFDIFVGQMISQINIDMPFETTSEEENIRNSIELSILNISEGSDSIPKEISTVSELITNLILQI